MLQPFVNFMNQGVKKCGKRCEAMSLQNVMAFEGYVEIYLPRRKFPAAKILTRRRFP